MTPLRIAGTTRHLGAPVDWNPDEQGPCGHLPIRDDRIDGCNFMTSRWEPTPDEMARLAAGAPIQLRIAGTVHPVVSLIVTDDVRSADVQG